MQHGQKVHDQPKDLISKTGNEVLDIPEDICVVAPRVLSPKMANHF